MASVSETWWSYVERIAKNVSQAAIARKIGVNKTTVWRWKDQGTSADPEIAIRFAREFHRPVTEALLAAGLITQAEANLREVKVHLDASSLSDKELLAEVERRMKR